MNLKEEINSINNKMESMSKRNIALQNALKEVVAIITPFMVRVKEHAEKDLYGTPDYYGQSCTASNWLYLKRITLDPLLKTKEEQFDPIPEVTTKKEYQDSYYKEPLSQIRGRKWASSR